MREFLFIRIKLMTLYILFRYYISFEINTICSNNQIFDPTILQCTICPENMVPNKNGNIFLNKHYLLILKGLHVSVQ